MYLRPQISGCLPTPGAPPRTQAALIRRDLSSGDLPSEQSGLFSEASTSQGPCVLLTNLGLAELLLISLSLGESGLSPNLSTSCRCFERGVCLGDTLGASKGSLSVAWLSETLVCRGRTPLYPS